MAEDKQSGGASEVLSKSASAAKTIQGAVKTGKAIAGIAKGAAAGGPYGAVAMGIWQNRKLVGKIILAAAFIMLLPILFILMLPALIFGGLNTDSPDMPVMNDNAAIYANIDDVNTKVNEVIDAAHATLLADIEAKIADLPSDSEHEIVDDFSSRALFDSVILISQYCAYKDNYEEIATSDLVSIVEKHKDNLFTYTETNGTREITRQKEVEVEKTITEYEERTVQDTNGNTRVEKIPIQKTVTVTETVEETVTVMFYTYTVNFVGESYFSNEIFDLNDEKAAYARDLADNLTIFLNDRDDEEAPKNSTHENILEKIKNDTGSYEGGVFAPPIENWQNYVTSECGWRTDPINGNQRYHNGMDIGISVGTPVYAAADGTVITAKKLNTGYGYHIILNHGGKLTTLYGHCSKLLVSEGDTVKKGDKIAESGSTGRSTGPHLHFEVHLNGEVMNPRDYLQ